MTLYSTALWDRLKVVLASAEAGDRVLKNTTRFLREKALLDQRYGKELRRLVIKANISQSSQIAYDNTNNSQNEGGGGGAGGGGGGPKTAMRNFLEAYDRLLIMQSENWETLSDKVMEEVVKPLDAMREKQTARLKRLQSEWENLRKQQRAVVQNLAAAHDQAKKLCLQYIKTKEAVERQLQQGGELWSTSALKDAHKRAIQADQVYQSAVKEARKFKAHYDGQKAKLLDTFEAEDLNRLSLLRHYFQHLLAVDQAVVGSLGNNNKSVGLCLEDLNVEADIQTFVAFYRTGKTPPSLPEYVMPYGHPNSLDNRQETGGGNPVWDAIDEDMMSPEEEEEVRRRRAHNAAIAAAAQAEAARQQARLASRQAQVSEYTLSASSSSSSASFSPPSQLNTNNQTQQAQSNQPATSPATGGDIGSDSSTASSGSSSASNSLLSRLWGGDGRDRGRSPAPSRAKAVSVSVGRGGAGGGGRSRNASTERRGEASLSVAVSKRNSGIQQSKSNNNGGNSNGNVSEKSGDLDNNSDVNNGNNNNNKSENSSGHGGSGSSSGSGSSGSSGSGGGGENNQLYTGIRPPIEHPPERLAAQSFFNDAFEKLLGGESLSQKELRQAEELFLNAHGRAAFKDVLSTQRTKAVNFKLTRDALRGIGELSLVFLNKAQSFMDVATVQGVMIMSQTLWCPPEGQEEKQSTEDRDYHLMSIIKRHHIWQDDRFWESSFFDSLQVGLQPYPQSPTAKQNKKEAEDLSYARHQVVISTLGTFAHNMRDFGVGQSKIHAFLDKFARLHSLTKEEFGMLTDMLHAAPRRTSVPRVEKRVVTQLGVHGVQSDDDDDHSPPPAGSSEDGQQGRGPTEPLDRQRSTSPPPSKAAERAAKLNAQPTEDLVAILAARNINADGMSKQEIVETIIATDARGVAGRAEDASFQFIQTSKRAVMRGPI